MPHVKTNIYKRELFQGNYHTVFCKLSEYVSRTTGLILPSAFTRYDILCYIFPQLDIFIFTFTLFHFIPSGIGFFHVGQLVEKQRASTNSWMVWDARINLPLSLFSLFVYGHTQPLVFPSVLLGRYRVLHACRYISLWYESGFLQNSQ